MVVCSVGVLEWHRPEGDGVVEIGVALRHGEDVSG